MVQCRVVERSDKVKEVKCVVLKNRRSTDVTPRGVSVRQYFLAHGQEREGDGHGEARRTRASEECEEVPNPIQSPSLHASVPCFVRFILNQALLDVVLDARARFGGAYARGHPYPPAGPFTCPAVVTGKQLVSAMMSQDCVARVTREGRRDPGVGGLAVRRRRATRHLVMWALLVHGCRVCFVVPAAGELENDKKCTTPTRLALLLSLSTHCGGVCGVDDFGPPSALTMTFQARPAETTPNFFRRCLCSSDLDNNNTLISCILA